MREEIQDTKEIKMDPITLAQEISGRKRNECIYISGRNY